ncbi:MAG: hypothetical protein HYY35_03665, partial [Deltaproteobacteria bacterium]|nr:hypothetical protein [Deltaproteobacteria bacterium]
NRFGPRVVMFFRDTSGNPTHRLLADDERAGVRAIYASGGGGGGGGCAVVRPGGRSDLLIVAAALAWLALRAARRRPARGSR